MQRVACHCQSLDDLAAVPMGFDGFDEAVFATLDVVRRHGPDLWWLYLSLCSACGQHWLVAQDERIYDQYFLKRLDPATTNAVTASGTWPDDFITYERVLALGRAMCVPPRFFDPLAYSLQWTVEDLRKERPAISPGEIAHLLGSQQRML